MSSASHPISAQQEQHNTFRRFQEGVNAIETDDLALRRAARAAAELVGRVEDKSAQRDRIVRNGRALKWAVTVGHIVYADDLDG